MTTLHEQLSAATAALAIAKEQRNSAIDRAERAEHALARIDYVLRAGLRDTPQTKVLKIAHKLLNAPWKDRDQLDFYKPALALLRNVALLYSKLTEAAIEAPVEVFHYEDMTIEQLAETGPASLVLSRIKSRGVAVWQAGQHNNEWDWFCTLSHKARWGDVFWKSEHCASLDSAICRAAAAWFAEQQERDLDIGDDRIGA